MSWCSVTLPPGLCPGPTRMGKFTEAPDPRLNWTLLHLWSLLIVCNSKIVGCPNVCFKHCNAMNSLLNKYAPCKKKLVRISLNLKRNIGLHLVFKNQSLKTNC